jgi:methionyl-tRNA formyltransferase
MSLANLVVLSSSHASNTHFIRAVHDAHPLRAVIRVTSAMAPRRRKTNRPWTIDRFIQSVERRLFYEHFYRWQNDRVTRDLGADRMPLPDVEVIDIPEDRINSHETAAKIHDLSTDLLIVHAAPLLAPAIFSAPTHGAINVHYGIAPDYRGENTLFWALFRRDYAKIGITVHRISRGIDAGEILCQGFPTLMPLDTEHSLNVKCARMASTVVNRLLWDWPRLGGSEPPTGRGRNFNRRDRRLYHDLVLMLRRSLFRERLPRLAERCQVRSEWLGQSTTGQPEHAHSAS